MSRRSLLIIASGLIIGGFAIGWLASRRFTLFANAETQRLYLRETGDAPDSVRSGVLQSLRAFQEGYRKKDPKELDAFMGQLFSKDRDALIIGTDVNEWRRGYNAITQFIKTDWVEWGDVQLAVETSVISSSGDVAWLATAGNVIMSNSSRPIRFTAALTRRDGIWIFRQLQFQWDERPLSLSDLIRGYAVTVHDSSPPSF